MRAHRLRCAQCRYTRAHARARKGHEFARRCCGVSRQPTDLPGDWTTDLLGKPTTLNPKLSESKNNNNSKLITNTQIKQHLASPPPQLCSAAFPAAGLRVWPPRQSPFRARDAGLEQVCHRRRAPRGGYAHGEKLYAEIMYKQIQLEPSRSAQANARGERRSRLCSVARYA